MQQKTNSNLNLYTENGITEITRRDVEMLILGRADFVFDGERIDN